MSTVTLVLFAAALVVAGAVWLWIVSQPEPKRVPVRRLASPRGRHLP